MVNIAINSLYHYDTMCPCRLSGTVLTCIFPKMVNIAKKYELEKGLLIILKPDT
jgi:hypothetical protein